MRLDFAAQIRLDGGRTVCTDNSITVDDDGAVLLHMQLMPEGSPILDLAIQPNSPVGIISAVVSAIIGATATTVSPGSAPRS